jgi:hypothetical protein
VHYGGGHPYASNILSQSNGKIRTWSLELVSSAYLCASFSPNLVPVFLDLLKETNTSAGGKVLDVSVHLLSCDLVSSSACQLLYSHLGNSIHHTCECFVYMLGEYNVYVKQIVGIQH